MINENSYEFDPLPLGETYLGVFDEDDANVSIKIEHERNLKTLFVKASEEYGLFK